MPDFCAYALLRSERQLPSKNAYGLDLGFGRLAAVCQKQGYSKDPRESELIRVEPLS